MHFANHTMLAYHPLIGVNNQKPLWQGEGLHLLSANHGTILPLLELPSLWPPYEMKHVKPNLFKWD